MFGEDWFVGGPGEDGFGEIGVDRFGRGLGEAVEFTVVLRESMVLNSCEQLGRAQLQQDHDSSLCASKMTVCICRHSL